jgi:hypothetical protein
MMIGPPPLDVTHHVGRLRRRKAGAPLVHDHQRQVEQLGVLAGQGRAPHIRADDRGIRELRRAKIVGQQRQRAQRVHGNVEKTLNRAIVNVHVDHPPRALQFQHVGHDARADRLAPFCHTLLPRIGKVGHHHAHAVRTGAAKGVQVEQRLDQMVVDRLATGLNQEDILIAHHFVEHDMVSLSGMRRVVDLPNGTPRI